MRSSLLVALVVSACLSADAATYDVKNGRHNITMGQRQLPYQYPRDFLLFHDTPKVDGSWLPYPKVQSQDLCYPPLNGANPYRFSITAFNVTDQIPGGEGGYAFVTKGGVKSGKLCLHLKSQRGKGYRFVIDVYGYYI